MNWKQIKKDCPKAWKLLCEAHSTIEAWGYIDHPDVWDMDGLEQSHNETRHLYDFFDEMGVYINVFITEHPVERTAYWDWEIFIDSQCMDSSEVEEPNRKEAETEAFKRAFEILEKQQFICPECKEQKDKWIDKCEDCTLKEFKYQNT